MTSLVDGWQGLFGRMERTRSALAEVEADRDDTITYLSTLRVVMEVLERARSFDQACQNVAEGLVSELGAETCVLAIRDRPEESLRLRGFANQSQRAGDPEPREAVTESMWVTAATLMAARGAAAAYRRDASGSLVEVDDVGLDSGLFGLPFRIGGEPNGVIMLEYLSSPTQRFARRPALVLVADIIGSVLTTCRTQDAMGRVLAELEREVGATRDELSRRERTLREREDSVEGLTQALVQSNRAKREFLGTVSHELRTPINAILGYSELLHDGLVGPLTEEQTTMLRRVMVSTRHLHQLIDDMLFFVQLDPTQGPVRRDDLSLDDLVREVAAALPERYHRSQTALRVEIDRGVARLRCDRALLKRVLFHLLANGFKFTSAGEVSLTAVAWPARSGVTIAVRDTGVGISEGRLEEIFQVFRQLDMSNTRRFSGLGLGLALVQRCVRMLGGEIKVQSAVGAGSEFVVLLPDVLPGADAPSAEPPAARG
jgi:signal transduction histidine kinase